MSSRMSKTRWLQRQEKDEYVKRSKVDGYRSRAVYKLEEINERDRIHIRGKMIIDLGAAPGGWSQLAAKWCQHKTDIIALDILPMDSLADVEIIQGDFTEGTVFEQLITSIDAREVGLVLSDMAPNISGVSSVDQPKSMYLAELALDLARQVLCKNGNFVTKVFQGEGFDQYMRDARSSFSSVKTRKPRASRPQSKEVYLVAKGYRGTTR
ncbi:MAG: 23S rRNA (uridine(2552)-2'-O)-methyltransferase RlmE [Gammaproteobacteria bacterium]|nr:23S rRNA (uridine(2552)-2'-O)-methyltransferase RlmE [Gammaproteobacteria bacterium]